jgi:hydroxymethylpyrimidine/phosphomethylpyrimidine kinase
MVATSGSTLLPQDATKAYLTALLPHTTILTPNLPEALLLAQLSGKDFGTVEKLSRDKRYELATFLSKQVQLVLLKGGHAPLELNGKNVVLDILVNANGQSKEFVSEFSTSRNTHGTGCTLACISPEIYEQN